MALEPLAEQLGVRGRMLREEGGAEARRERRLRLRDADLGARHLGRVAGEEVEERLLRRQPRDRRQHPEGVRGEHDDGGRVPRALRRQVVRDLLELVGGARVLRLRVVVEVEHAALVHDDVLEHRPERLRRAVDLGLGLRGQPDHLRVAAAFHVEDAVVRPAVLVVADQMALGVGGEGRLAGPGEAEEDRHAPVAADVRGAVHRHHVSQGQPVVHDREDRLLDLARVVRAPDQHLRPARVEHDEGGGTRAVDLGIGLDGGRVQHERFRLVAAEVLLRRIDEERLREQRVPRAVA